MLWFDESKLREVLKRRKPTKYFWCDMTDIFGEWVPDWWIDQCFATMALTPHHTHQVLTKRPERMAAYFSDGHRNGRGVPTSVFVAREMTKLADQHGIDSMKLDEVSGLGDSWPPNIWAGVSVENQAAADERIPLLLKTPAAVRFLSCEPLLGPVDLRPKAPDAYAILGKFYGTGTFDPSGMSPAADRVLNCFPKIDWCILGGESGPGARPCNLEWIRSLVRQCRAGGTACFVKQLGTRPRDDATPETVHINLGRVGGLKLRDRKGGDIEEFPADLRVREFPK